MRTRSHPTQAAARVLLFAALLAACGNDAVAPDEADAAPLLRTDAAAYQWTTFPGGYRLAFIARLTNRTGQPLYYTRCQPDDDQPGYVVRRVPPDTGIPFIGGHLDARPCLAGQPAVVLAPGASRTDSIVLRSSVSPSASPPIRPEERIGRVEVRYALFTRLRADGQVDHAALLRPELSRSNAFTLSY